ncbi:MAG: TetR/AcrR family transcriptional regulator [Mycobacterium sp.]|nr:TetR/AcrR family transcriptional regulator [Mycobacterium sp.]
MTHQGDPFTHRQAHLSHSVRPRRNKLAPDPDVRRAILAAASKSVREQGVQGLSVAAVLEHAQLSTRAFYRHFESKDQLVAAVFLEMTHAEVLRLRTRMGAAANPVEAVVSWIDGRIDLAFNDDIRPELRQMPSEAPSTLCNPPDSIPLAYNAILEPLIEQLERGLDLGVFHGIVPASAAQSIHGVVWAATPRHRTTGCHERAEVRDGTIRFCLRGLAVAPETIEEIAAQNRAADT